MINNLQPQVVRKDTVTIDRSTAKAILQFINKSKQLAHKAEHTHRELFELMGIKQYSGIRNDIAAMAYDVGHEFNFWIDEFAEKVNPTLRIANF